MSELDFYCHNCGEPCDGFLCDACQDEQEEEDTMECGEGKPGTVNEWKPIV